MVFASRAPLFVLSFVFALFLATGCGGARTVYNTLTEADVKREKLKQRSIRQQVSNLLITEAYATDRCGAMSRGGFIWIEDEVDLAAWLTPLASAESQQILARLPFATQGALIVDFGSVPTPGYTIALTSNRLRVGDVKAVLQIDLVEPSAPGKAVTGNTKPGKRMPQQLAHPCKVLAVPKTGYSTLEIQSSLGDVLTSFNVSN